MRLKMNVVIALLVLFCFTVSLLMVIPIRSSSPYDPWLDIDDNGSITMTEVSAELDAFGATGNPTKPVIINDNYTEQSYSNTVNPYSDWTLHINTAGFREVTISFSGASAFPGTLTYNIYVGFYRAGLTNIVDNFTDTAENPVPAPPYPPGFNNWPTRTYEITGSQIVICIFNPASPYQPYKIFTEQVAIFMTA